MGKKPNTVRIRDIVSVRPHPTVVRLDDLKASDNDWLQESFVVTDEVQKALHALESMLDRGDGCGVFLIGHYGSGKSHFLAWWCQRLAGADHHPDPYPLSLLNFGAENRLEDIVGGVLGIAEGSGDRRPRWDALLESHPRGAVLLLDELSEFLRSKRDERAFNEDVRFLQFLGEWARGKPFWIVAAMQESIEHTGELEHGLYRKIKDRYPLRLALNPAHVESLIAEGILQKKEGYAEHTAAVVSGLKRAFPRSQVDFARLTAIYPIHPATLALLEEIRDRFSQARGVVDFTVKRLAGDPDRSLPPLLDEPVGHLLTPDTIVDHFRDLFDIQPEFLPLAQKLLPWYDKHLAELFDKPALVELAGRLLRLLVLVHLSPARDTLSLAEAADWLLYDVSHLEPERNLKIVERVLQQLNDGGRYVVREAGGYRLELAHDHAGDVERLLRRELERLPSDAEAMCEELVGELPKDAFQPFELPRNRWQNRHLRWHFHDRPYAVLLGDGEPSQKEGPALCLRLPWGEQRRAAGCYVFVPAVIKPEPELRELAALTRLAAQALAPELAQLVAARRRRLLPRLAQAVRQAFADGELFRPDGQPARGVSFDTRKGFEPWLEQIALWMMQQRYPAFERFAPSHGPLPREANVSLMKEAAAGDLLAAEADPYVKLIREAYLVPMGLLNRQGRGYRVPARLERNELVAQVLSMLDSEPAPAAIYRHFADSAYGLTADQVTLLLIFLLVQGEVDIRKGRHSYRDHFETLPNPIQYDKVCTGDSLSDEGLNALRRCVETLELRAPRHWTVLNQRRTVEELAAHGEKLSRRLGGLVDALENTAGSEGLLERIQQHREDWRRLRPDRRDPLAAFEQFFYELDSLGTFLDEASALARLPDRLERLSQELRRVHHLRSLCDALKGSGRKMAREVIELEQPPSLDKLDAVESWLREFETAWETYRWRYRAIHDEWWKEAESHSIWRWKPPPLAASRHVGLDSTLADIERLQSSARKQRCSGISGLDFQPLCRCGFDGARAPLADELERFDALRRQVESQLAFFFARTEVRDRLAGWQAQGGETDPATQGYLQGDEALPGIADVSRLDDYLGGLDLCRSARVEPLVELLTERVWQPEGLLDALKKRIDDLSKGRSLKFETAGSADTDEWLRWSLETALNHAVPLPPGIGERADAALASRIDLSAVSPRTLEELDRLQLGPAVEDRLAQAMLSGELPPSESPAEASLAAAVGVIAMDPVPSEPEARCRAVLALYRHQHRLRPHASQRVREALDRLATAPLDALPALEERLADQQDAQWLIIDCLGPVLLDAAGDVIETRLRAWRVSERGYALASKKSDTDAFYRSLLDRGLSHRLHKIDRVDELIHESRGSFTDLEKRVATELDLALADVNKRLDPDLPVLLFADHGFRRTERERYTHGGASSLERLVPLWRLVPRH